MASKLPEKKMVAALFEQPQVFAIEIRIDRVDLFSQDAIDIEDTALWVQVLDLPCMEMLPYQRDHLSADSSETLNSSDVADRSQRSPSSTNQSVKIAKKDSTSVINKNYVDFSLVDVQAAEEEQRRKLRDKRQSVYRKEKIKKQALKHQKSAIKVNKPSRTSSVTEINRKKSVSRSISLKITDNIKSNSETEIRVEEEPKIESKENRVASRETFKDSESMKKIKLISKLLADQEPENEGQPAGVAFNSDCCIVVPFPNVSTALYKMERLPVIFYVVQMSHACSKLVGKVCFPLGYCFKQAVIEAAKLRGGVVSHAVQESFPVYSSDKKCSITGYLYGSIKLICYGNFGITEIKGPNGDLMSSRFREWKSDFRDLSQGLGREGVNLDEQPYGFTPTVAKSNLTPLGKQCPSPTPPESMFDFIQFFYNPQKMQP